ncbi:hypothetical protein [Phascolarctobacterium sp.]|nr:hypothetical protein [uncultured Phascolarctobacterium sp.]
MAGEIGRTQDAPMKHDSGYERKRDNILRTAGNVLFNSFNSSSLQKV